MNWSPGPVLSKTQAFAMLEDFVNLNSFISKPDYLVYQPAYACSFSSIGESMVSGLVTVSYAFHCLCNHWIPLDQQIQMQYYTFHCCKEAWHAKNHADPALYEAKMQRRELAMKEEGKRPSKKYFEQNRHWKGFCPSKYRRSASPRLTADGGTFHRMETVMKHALLSNLSNELDYTFMDVDLSGAHAHVATSLQGCSHSLLRETILQEGQFWDERTAHYFPQFSALGLDLNRKELRKVLKVSLYTSLNGGNPLSPARLFENLSNHAGSLMLDSGLMADFGSHPTYDCFNQILKDDPLIKVYFIFFLIKGVAWTWAWTRARTASF